jgi:hypothetical protein
VLVAAVVLAQRKAQQAVCAAAAVLVVEALCDFGYLPHPLALLRPMPSGQVVLAQRLVLAAQEVLRCSDCTLKPRAAAVVQLAQRHHQ